MDSNGNLEIYPNAANWAIQDTTIEFNAGILVDADNQPRIVLNHPHLQQLISVICRYTFYQDKEDLDLMKVLAKGVGYYSQDSI